MSSGMAKSYALPSEPMRPATAVTVVGAIGAAVAPFLPWARSGRAVRSGFALLHAAQRLQLATSGPMRTLLVAVALLPLLAAAVWTTAALEWRRVMAGFGAGAGVVAIVGAVVVWRSPVEPLVGPVVSVVAGAVAVIGAAWTVGQEMR
jgi:hypothetical protein